MMKEVDDDSIYRRTVVDRDGKEIDIVKIGNVLLARDSLGSKFYRVAEEDDFDEKIINMLEEE